MEGRLGCFIASWVPTVGDALDVSLQVGCPLLGTPWMFHCKLGAHCWGRLGCFITSWVPTVGDALDVSLQVGCPLLGTPWMFHYKLGAPVVYINLKEMVTYQAIFLMLGLVGTVLNYYVDNNI